MPVAPLAPPPQSAVWVSSLSTLLMFSGIILVLCALPPVRRLAARAVDSAEKVLIPPKRPAKVTQPVPAGDAAPADAGSSAAEPVTQPASRREIDQFDLSIFEE